MMIAGYIFLLTVAKKSYGLGCRSGTGDKEDLTEVNLSRIIPSTLRQYDSKLVRDTENDEPLNSIDIEALQNSFLSL